MRYLLLGSLMFAHVAHGAIFVVDTTSASELMACTAAPGDCSLRGAITRANADAVPDTIAFDIPISDSGYVPASGNVPDFWRITPAGPTPSLPVIQQPLTIDGYTQPGAVPNTNTPAQGGLNTLLKIEIDASAGSHFNAPIQAEAMVTVRGLAINNASPSNPHDGIYLDATADGSVIEGNFIGTDVTGRTTRAMQAGIQATSGCCGDPLVGVRIGGTLPAQRNLLSGNRRVGIDTFASPLIQGNLIGTDITGNAALGNADGGVLVRTSCNIPAPVDPFIGGDAAGRNVVSGNGGIGIAISSGGAGCSFTASARIFGNYVGIGADGQTPLGNSRRGIDITVLPPAGNPLQVGDGTAAHANVIAFTGAAGGGGMGLAWLGDRTQIQRNQVFANAGLGRDVGSPANARNVNDPGDADSNEFSKLQNHPEINAFTPGAATLGVSFRVDSTTANSTYPLHVEFYRARGDEGEEFLGSDSYAASDALLLKTVALALPAGVVLSSDDVVVATAEDAVGNPSELSFHTAALTLMQPEATACTSTDSVFCNDFESALPSLFAVVRAQAMSGPFKPNGRVLVSDNRGASCTATLRPTTTPLVSEARCVLSQSGAPGPITITATLDASDSAFAAADGSNAMVVQGFVVP